jgi:hypothetical protein
LLACLHPPMVVGWPGSEAADRASGPPHAFEARANRTLPHRCNLLLAYHCLLACFACLLLQGTIMADQWEVAEEMLDFAALQSNPIDEEGSELERLLEEEYNGYDGDLGYEEPTMLVAALASARLDCSGDANGGGSSDGASGSDTRQGSSSSVTQRRPHEEATLGEVIPSMPGGPALARAAAATWPPTYAQFHSPKMSCPTLDVRVVFTKSLTLFSVHLSLVLLLLLTLFPRVPSYLKP